MRSLKNSFLCLIVSSFIAVTSWAQIVPIDTVVDPGTGGDAFTISPTTTMPDKEFNLQLLSYDFTCAYVYSHKKVDVKGNSISLTFLPEDVLDVICPAVYLPYGPEFEMPPLEPGVYKVSASVLAPCMLSNPACEMYPVPQDAGTLTVTRDGGWYLSKEVAPLDEDFELQILNLEHGNCFDSYDHLEVDQARGEITLGFLPINNPDNICVVNITPHGPTFSIEALAAGNYDVYVVEHLACEYQNPVCAVKVARELIGSLHVYSKDPETPTTWITPTSVANPGPVTLEVWSEGFNCNSVFTATETKVEKGSITIMYDYMETRMLCPTVIEAHMAEFSLPALEPGTYDIYLSPNEPCEFPGFACSDWHQTNSVGSLTVGKDGTVSTSRFPGLKVPELKLESGKITLDAGDPAELYSIKLYDLQGNIWFHSDVNNQAALKFENRLPPGAYFILLKLMDGREFSARQTLAP